MMMPAMSADRPFELHSCRQLFELYAGSTSLRPAVEVIERTIRDEPGIAFTHCRGLLETVCITILADRGVEIPPDSKPNWLMSQAVKSLELTALNPDDKEAERGVAGVLKGLNSLVDGVVALRNSQGVGPHGARRAGECPFRRVRDANRYRSRCCSRTHVPTAPRANGRDPINHLRFGVHSDFDEYLDCKYSDIQVEEVPISASQALYHQDRLAYRRSLVEFRNRSDDKNEGIVEGEMMSEGSDG